MKTWEKTRNVIQIEREMPTSQPTALILECVDGPHKADLLHRGTAYCRSHYEERGRIGKLIN